MVLLAGEGKAQIHFQRAQFTVHLIRRGEIRRFQLLQDFVGLVDIAFVQLQMFLDRFGRNAVELHNLRAEVKHLKVHANCLFNLC